MPNAISILERDAGMPELARCQQLLARIQSLPEAKDLIAAADALRTFIKKARLGLANQNVAAAIAIKARRKAGEIAKRIERNIGGQRDTGVALTTGIKTAADQSGIKRRTLERWQTLAAGTTEEDIDEAAAKATEAGKELTTSLVMGDSVREANRTSIRRNLEDLAARDALAPSGIFDVIVIDPPWPMQRIERDVRPNQVEFDYPTMSEEEIGKIVIPAAEDCHLWLWTTQKFLPIAFALLELWDFRYVCTFVWHKPGGFQPVDLPQFNCEFAVYARKGSPVFLDTKAFPTCFDAPRGKHSEKPEAFYEMVRRVTGGRRLDMFNRRPIEGFTGSGKESK